jgi:hypothetical protein
MEPRPSKICTESETLDDLHTFFCPESARRTEDRCDPPLPTPALNKVAQPLVLRK